MNDLNQPMAVSRTQIKFSLKTLVLAFTFAGVFIALLALIPKGIYETKQGIRCQYGLWQVREMIAIKIRRESLLPKEWDDLEEEFTITKHTYGNTFEELRETVYIDFDLLHAAINNKASCSCNKSMSCEFIRCRYSLGRKTLMEAEITVNNQISKMLYKHQSL